MNTQTKIYFSLFIATTCVSLAIAQGDPTAILTYKIIDVKVFDNPYVDAVVGEIHPSGNKVSLKVPVNEDFPPTMMIRGSVEFMGGEIASMDMPLCEAIEDEIFGKSVRDAGIPKGKFPQKCPIKSNGDYVIKDYIFPPNKIPFGLPDGLAVLDAEMYEPGKDPYAVVHVEVELSHKIPGFGR